MVQWMESFEKRFVCCFNDIEILQRMRNRPFSKVSKFKIKSGKFGCFHVGDTRFFFSRNFIFNNFIWMNFFGGKFNKNCQFLIKIQFN